MRQKSVNVYALSGRGTPFRHFHPFKVLQRVTKTLYLKAHNKISLFNYRKDTLPVLCMCVLHNNNISLLAQ